LIELPKERTADEMIAPKNDWTWCSGSIKHFDMEMDLKDIVKAITLAITKNLFSPNYIHSSSSHHSEGWEDYTVDFLSADEEEKWELPSKYFLFLAFSSS
jgi:hypothetical protein